MNRSHFELAGVPFEHLDAVEKANIPWQTILGWLIKYGPKVFAIVAQVVNSVAPGTPTATIINLIEQALQGLSPQVVS